VKILHDGKKWVTTTQSFQREDDLLITDFDDFCIWVFVVVMDSLPFLAVQFHLAPGSTRDCKGDDAAFGKVPTKKWTIFGYRLSC
jgi:hypothetical protein